MVVLLPVCVPCANGDHSSHNGHEGLAHGDPLDNLDLYDCKATSDDGRDQCMCRATWPGVKYDTW